MSLLKPLYGARIVDAGLDLLTVANDGRVLEQPLHAGWPHARHLLDAPAVKGFAEGVPAGQDHAEVEARLEYLEAHDLEQRIVIAHASAPDLVDVPLVEPFEMSLSVLVTRCDMHTPATPCRLKTLCMAYHTTA